MDRYLIIMLYLYGDTPIRTFITNTDSGSLEDLVIEDKKTFRCINILRIENNL